MNNINKINNMNKINRSSLRKKLSGQTNTAFTVLICFALIVVISGCNNPANLQHTPPKSLENVNLQLKWYHQAQFAGNYVAVEKGFYADKGFNVTITQLSPSASYIDAVVSGKALFGIAGADEIMIARQKGIPIKAIAVIYKINPVCAYALKSSGIKKPQDFINKTVGLEKSGNVQYLYAVMMSKLHINRSQIKEVPIGYDASELINGTVDVGTGYVINEPQSAKEEGYDVNTILAAEYGADIYADVLFTTDTTINEQPEMVGRFVQATLEGWQYSIENAQEAVNMTLLYDKKNSRVHEEYMLQQSIPLIHTGESPLGWMDAVKWENGQNILYTQGLLNKTLDVQEYYTNTFVESIYPNNKG